MSPLQELQVRQEARFVLWALRCAMGGERGEEGAAGDLARGFALLGVSDTAGSFQDFVRALFAMDWSLEVWHGQRCCCVSAQEVFVLNALAETAQRQRHADAQPAQWWQLVLPVERIAAIDAAARVWLMELEEAGVVLPGPDLLETCLRPLQNIAAPATSARVH